MLKIFQEILLKIKLLFTKSFNTSLSCGPGLCQSEGAIVLHPHGADGAGGEEVADHPRPRGGGVEGSVHPEDQPLSGVPVWRPPAHTVQGQSEAIDD